MFLTNPFATHSKKEYRRSVAFGGAVIEHTSLNVSVRLPYVMFVLLLMSFTILHHSTPKVPWIMAIFLLDASLILNFPTRSKPGLLGRGGSDFIPLLVCVFSGTAAIALGLYHCSILEPWVSARYLREHSGVTTTTPTAAVKYAGVIRFADDITLATGNSAGYVNWPETYCAAPVVLKNDLSPSTPIRYWAVGTGCCDHRGKFWCDGADDKNARGGLRLTLTKQLDANYHRAARMAAAAHGLSVSENPVFVAWSEDPTSMTRSALWLVIFLSLLWTLIASVCCFVGHMSLYDRQQLMRLLRL